MKLILINITENKAKRLHTIFVDTDSYDEFITSLYNRLEFCGFESNKIFMSAPEIDLHTNISDFFNTGGEINFRYNDGTKYTMVSA